MSVMNSQVHRASWVTAQNRPDYIVSSYWVPTRWTLLHYDLKDISFAYEMSYHKQFLVNGLAVVNDTFL